jgi:hypothetical protein
MLLTNTVSAVQARITICLERFRGTQKEDKYGSLSVHSILSEWKRKFISYGGEGRVVRSVSVSIFRITGISKFKLKISQPLDRKS